MFISATEFQDTLTGGGNKVLGGLWNLREMVLPLPSQWCDRGPVFELSEPQFLMVQTEMVTPNFHGVRGTEREGEVSGVPAQESIRL